jgi:signal transduction histidine kinase
MPVRRQVTLAFAATLAVVLLAVGSVTYLRFHDQLMDTVDAGLRSRAAEIAGVLRSSGSGAGLAETDAMVSERESFTQVLTDRGRVLAAAPSAARARVLTAAELARALRGPLVVERGLRISSGDRTRMRAEPVRAGGQDHVVVVGATVDDTRDSLSALAALLAAGLGAALLLASAAGYWVAGLALRPVEAMRRQAEEISGAPGGRLPVPPVDDEVGRLGATLNAMLARLEQALASERRFVADASHELRTPLTVLKSELEVALHRDRTPVELRAALASAGEEADRLVLLAEDLLVLARADEGRLPLRREAVRVRELLDTAARRRAGEGRAITVDAPAGLTVHADPVRLDQALANLVENALRHGSAPVQLSAVDGAGEVRIAVRDHGPGFPADFAPRAFERFSRPGSGRSGAGTGLGLAIVRAIAEAHGGSARVVAVPEGARVELVLPALTVRSSASVSVGGPDGRTPP